MKKNRLGKQKVDKYGYAFGWPLMLVMVLLLLYPIIQITIMSFQSWYLLRPQKNGVFIGWNNFNKLFQDKYFWSSVRKTAVYMLVTIPVRYILGFVTAILLNRDYRGRAIYRAMVIIPWAVPEVVTCLIWMLMYQKDYGIINKILLDLGWISSGVGWISDTNVAMTSAIIVNIWKGFPFVALMLLAGMQSIPEDVYEAAKMDGASSFKIVTNIVIPLLRPVSAVVFMLLVVWTIRDYGIVYVLTGGGPSRATEVLTIYMYKKAFSDFNYGIAAASGFIMMIVAFVFVYFYMKAQKNGGMEL